MSIQRCCVLGHNLVVGAIFTFGLSDTFIYIEICSQKGGGVCQGLTSLLRGGVQCLTNADKGGRGSKRSKNMLTSYVNGP